MRDTRNFKRRVWDFYKTQGRNLPWRKTRDPYKILVSEIMLQQTRVSQVLKIYPRFLKTFPDFKTLDKVPFRDILRVWKGLGYNQRALALKKIAGIVVRKYGGKLPKTQPELLCFPGIGEATSQSILVFAFNVPEVFIETNIRRVFLYHFFPKKDNVSDHEIIKWVRKTLDYENPREWYFALMDYGSTLPKSANRRSSRYIKQKPFKGSLREIRGKILSILLEKGSVSRPYLSKRLDVKSIILRKILLKMKEEGLLVFSKNRITLS